MSASSPRREALPPVIELGRSLSAIDTEYGRLDLHRLESQDLDGVSEQMETLYWQGQALRDLIATLPATTMPDAAVQIGVAAILCGDLSGLDLEDDDDRVGLRRKHEALHQMMLSVLPIVAKAAGINPDEMSDWAELIAYRARLFGKEARP